MKDMLIFLGSAALSVIIMSIPVLTTCSFTLNWGSFLKFILTLFTIGEFVILTSVIGNGE